jgi:pro-sigmaK processing inhibitor BofA
MAIGVSGLIILALAAGALFLIFLIKPLRWLWHVGLRATLGGVCMWGISVLFPAFGVVGVNMTTLLVAGVLGLPGVAALYVTQFLMR